MATAVPEVKVLEWFLCLLKWARPQMSTATEDIPVFAFEDVREFEGMK